MYRNNHSDILIKEKMRLLDESLMLIERLKKMRAIGATAKLIGINPHILTASGLENYEAIRMKKCA